MSDPALVLPLLLWAVMSTAGWFVAARLAYYQRVHIKQLQRLRDLDEQLAQTPDA